MTYNIQYIKKTKTLKISGKFKDFSKEYIEYLFIRLKIPLTNGKVIFADKTITGGLENVRKEYQNTK